jgi:hypothetical protein
MTYDISLDRLHYELDQLLDFELANLVLEFHVQEEPPPENLFSQDPECRWYEPDALELGLHDWLEDQSNIPLSRQQALCHIKSALTPSSRTPPDVNRHDVMASLQSMFPAEFRTRVDDDEASSTPALVPSPASARTSAKHPTVCNIEFEQLWRILDRQFGYGTTSVVMSYWTDEAPPAEDLFHQRFVPIERGLRGVEVYNQVPDGFNDAFYEQFSVVDRADEALVEWMAAEREAALAQLRDKRPDVMSSMREVFVVDKTRVEEEGDWFEDCKDEDMSDAAPEVWNDVWQAPASHANAFEGLFNDEEELFSFVDDDWGPTGRLTSAAMDSEARAEGSMFGMAF